jgi:hypothetical protein
MYERARPFHLRKAVSHSIVQVYVWNREYDLAREEIQAWRAENPNNKYPVYFAPQPAMMTGDLEDSKRSCWTSPKGHHNRWSLMAVVANQAVAFDKSMLMACPHLGDVLRPGLILDHEQPGSYRFVLLISTEKR